MIKRGTRARCARESSGTLRWVVDLANRRVRRDAIRHRKSARQGGRCGTGQFIERDHVDMGMRVRTGMGFRRLFVLLPIRGVVILSGRGMVIVIGIRVLGCTLDLLKIRPRVRKLTSQQKEGSNHPDQPGGRGQLWHGRFVSRERGDCQRGRLDSGEALLLNWRFHPARHNPRPRVRRRS